MKLIQPRWILMTAVVGVCLALAGCGGGTSNSAADASVAVVDAAIVNVTAKDFSFDLAPADIPSGPVTFDVKNDGGTVHDFAVSGNGVDQKTSFLQSGRDGSFTVDLKPGTYSYLCTVPSHKELGMAGTFTVK